MKYLIDTVVFLWMFFGEKKEISARALKILEGDNELYLSAVSTWEIAIKYSIGKLSLKEDPQKWLPQTTLKMGLKQLPISQRHALAIIRLAKHHKDPFDRLLAAQTLAEKMTLISPDGIFKKYEVDVVW